MPYFNYHATAQHLLRAGKLRDLRVVERYHGISPALLLYFDDAAHPVMPIREHRFDEYFSLIASLYPPDAAQETRKPPAPPTTKKTAGVAPRCKPTVLSPRSHALPPVAPQTKDK